MPRPKTTVRRVTISLREADDRNLRFVADCTRLSENDSIRKALATEAQFQQWLGKGRTILKLDGTTGLIHEIVFVG